MRLVEPRGRFLLEIVNAVPNSQQMESPCRITSRVEVPHREATHAHRVRANRGEYLYA